MASRFFRQVCTGGLVMRTSIGIPEQGRTASRRARVGRVVWATVALVVLVLGAALVYVAVEGSARFVAAYASDTCTTPASQPYGWPYDAINYDQADDTDLAEQNPDMSQCVSQGVGAGEAVVAEDGTRLAGWYIPAVSPEVGRPTLLLVHGHDGNKSDMLPIATLLHDRYDLVLMDLRASGRSSGQHQTMGVEEQMDVAAMLDWLAANKQPEHVAALAVSGGVAATLARARTDGRIEAVIADSAHARWQTLLEREIERTPVLLELHQPAYPGAWAVSLGIWARTGDDISSVDPIDSLAALGDRPILILHGTADDEDIPEVSADRNYAAALTRGLDAELRYCQGGEHAGLATGCPDEYRAWVVEFLDQAFSTAGG